MTTRTLSVVIPVYNGERYIQECLESVLGQSLKPSEIIVVDDGSSDQTMELVRAASRDILCLEQKRLGPAAARNRGVEAASGEYLAFIDADDLWTKEKLARQMSYLLGNPATDMVFGMMRQFFSPEADEAFKKRYACPDETAPGIHPGAILLKKETFLRIGFFDASLRMGEFIQWQARAQTLACVRHVLPDLVMLRRIHPANYGITHKDLRKDYLTIAKTMLARKKEQGA